MISSDIKIKLKILFAQNNYVNTDLQKKLSGNFRLGTTGYDFDNQN